MTTDTPPELPDLLAQISAWATLDNEEAIVGAPINVQAAYQCASSILSNLRVSDVDPWLGRRIHSIIRKSTKFIVYLDEDLEVQWWWLTRPDQNVVSTVQARINQLTHESAFLLDDNVDGTHTREAEDIRCAIGEAMAVALNRGTRADCEHVLAEAARFITVAKDQRCRPIFLGWFIAIVGVLALLALGAHALVTAIPAALPFVPLAWLQASAAGAFGALVSAMMRTKDLGLEPAAGHAGMRIDAIARTTIGAGAGIIVYLAFDAGIVLKNAFAAELQDAVRMFLCITAGASERMLPSLVERADSLINGAAQVETADGAASPVDPATRKPRADDEAVG